ncbi:MAG: hypothetical protein DRJ05_08025 [Bacteroidetes bacterium]|nr:MAG: hypothetical protein DRJ05_08025 [Bacteroidota bacterium]
MRSRTIIVFYLIVLLTGVAISGYSNGIEDRGHLLSDIIKDQINLNRAENVYGQLDARRADCIDIYFQLFFYEGKDQMAMNLFPKVATKKVNVLRYVEKRKYVSEPSDQIRNQRKC